MTTIDWQHGLEWALNVLASNVRVAALLTHAYRLGDAAGWQMAVDENDFDIYDRDRYSAWAPNTRGEPAP